MTQQACTPRPPRRKPWPRVPPFYPVPALRSRRGGWSPRRQADFLGFLAETGSVLAACERVGLSREAAYKLRRRDPVFALAWDVALQVAYEARVHRMVDALPERTIRTLSGLSGSSTSRH